MTDAVIVQWQILCHMKMEQYRCHKFICHKNQKLNFIYVTRSAKKVHKSLYAFTRTGPFYVERVTKSSNKQFLREGIFNILDTYIFILHNQKC